MEQHLVLIDACTNCSQHQWCSRHQESRYLEAFQKIRQFLLDRFEGLQVRRATLAQIQFLREERVRCFGEEQRYQRGKLGGFQIFFDNILIFSKFQSKQWPRLDWLQTIIQMAFDILKQTGDLGRLVQFVRHIYQQDRQKKRLQNNRDYLKQKESESRSISPVQKSKVKTPIPCEYHHKASLRQIIAIEVNKITPGVNIKNKIALMKKTQQTKQQARQSNKAAQAGEISQNIINKSLRQVKDFQQAKLEKKKKKITKNEVVNIKQKIQRPIVNSKQKVSKMEIISPHKNIQNFVKNQEKKKQIKPTEQRYKPIEINNYQTYKQQQQQCKLQYQKREKKLLNVKRIKKEQIDFKSRQKQSSKRVSNKIGTKLNKIPKQIVKLSKTKQGTNLFGQNKLDSQFRQQPKLITQIQTNKHNQQLPRLSDTTRPNHIIKHQRQQTYPSRQNLQSKQKNRSNNKIPVEVHHNGQHLKSQNQSEAQQIDQQSIPQQEESIKKQQNMKNSISCQGQFQQIAKLKNNQQQNNIEQTKQINYKKWRPQYEQQKQKVRASNNQQLKKPPSLNHNQDQLYLNDITTQKSMAIDMIQSGNEEVFFKKQQINNLKKLTQCKKFSKVLPNQVHKRKTIKQDSSDEQQLDNISKAGSKVGSKAGSRTKKSGFANLLSKIGTSANPISVQQISEQKQINLFAKTRQKLGVTKFEEKDLDLKHLHKEQRHVACQSQDMIPVVDNYVDELRKLTVQQLIEQYQVDCDSELSRPVLCVLYTGGSGKRIIVNNVMPFARYQPDHIPVDYKDEVCQNSVQSAVQISNEITMRVQQIDQAVATQRDRRQQIYTQTSSRRRMDQSIMVNLFLDRQDNLSVKLKKMIDSGTQAGEPLIACPQNSPKNSKKSLPAKSSSPRALSNTTLHRYVQASIVSQFINISTQFQQFGKNTPGLGFPADSLSIRAVVKDNQELSLGLQAVMSLGQSMISRLFDNAGRIQNRRMRIWTFDNLWKLKQVQGLNWLQVLNREFGTARAETIIDRLTGSSVLTLDVKQKQDRIWKLCSMSRMSLEVQRSCLHYFCIPKRSGLVVGDRVYQITETRVILDQEQKLVKLESEGESLWVKFQQFIQQFQRVLIANTGQRLLHLQVQIPIRRQPYTTMFYFLLKFKGDSHCVFRQWFEGQRNKYTLAIYAEVERNKFELEARVKGSSFTKTFTKGVHLFFVEGFKPRWGQRGEFIEEGGWIAVQSTSKVKLKLGKWLQNSPQGYEQLKELFVPMVQQVQEKTFRVRSQQKFHQRKMQSCLRKLQFDAAKQNHSEVRISRRRLRLADKLSEH